MFQRKLTRLQALEQLNAIIFNYGQSNQLPLTPWVYDRIVHALKSPGSSLPSLFIHYYRPGQVVAVIRDWNGVWK